MDSSRAERLKMGFITTGIGLKFKNDEVASLESIGFQSRKYIKYR